MQLGTIASILLLAGLVGIEVYGCAVLAAQEDTAHLARGFVLAHCVALPMLGAYILVFELVQDSMHDAVSKRWSEGWRMAPIFVASTSFLVGGSFILKDMPSGAQQRRWVGIYLCHLVLDCAACIWSTLIMVSSTTLRADECSGYAQRCAVPINMSPDLDLSPAQTI